MLSSRWLFAPFVLHALCMAVDEFYFHYRRGLSRWERLGHPLDTLTVFVCQAWLCWQSPSAFSVSVYVALCVISCLFVTKDEFVHQRECTGGEHWMHAAMFTLHPLVLAAAGLLWSAASLPFIVAEGWEASALRGNLVIIFCFGLYQLIFWNWLWQRLPETPLITKFITR
jgi:hypothetical protein